MKLGGDKRIDRYLHLLKRHSESNGGTVTYHVVVDVIEKTGCESTSAANGWKHNYYSIYDGETTRPTAQGGSYDRFLVKLLEKCRSGIPIRGWRLS